MYNHVTVIPDDKIVLVDGQALKFDFVAPEGMHALQWHDGAGHIEWKAGENEILAERDYTAKVKRFADAWEAEKSRLEAEANRPPTLDEARAAKLMEISAAFERAGSTAHVMSSLGFEIDANERANRDTEGLITVFTATGAAGTMFCDYNNVMREVTLEQLKTIRLEIIAHGQALYAKKWVLREAVNAAQTVADIQAVVWED